MKKLQNNLKKLLDELKSIKYLQSKLIDVAVDNEMNDLLGINSFDIEKDSLDIGDTFKMKIIAKGNKQEYDLQKQLSHSYTVILNIAVELNTTLENPFEELSQIKIAKEKDILTVLDVQLLYSFSKSQQANYRARLHDALPYLKEDSKSKSSNSKILYNAEQVEKWFQNNFEN